MPGGHFFSISLGAALLEAEVLSLTDRLQSAEATTDLGSRYCVASQEVMVFTSASVGGALQLAGE